MQGTLSDSDSGIKPTWRRKKDEDKDGCVADDDDVGKNTNL